MIIQVIEVMTIVVVVIGAAVHTLCTCGVCTAKENGLDSNQAVREAHNYCFKLCRKGTQDTYLGIRNFPDQHPWFSRGHV
jgi:hypothetical protein